MSSSPLLRPPASTRFAMSVRRRLRSIIESRQAGQICWRCALNRPRYQSTVPARVLGSPHDGGDFESFRRQRKLEQSEHSLPGTSHSRPRKPSVVFEAETPDPVLLDKPPIISASDAEHHDDPIILETQRDAGLSDVASYKTTDQEKATSAHTAVRFRAPEDHKMERGEIAKPRRKEHMSRDDPIKAFFSHENVHDNTPRDADQHDRLANPSPGFQGVRNYRSAHSVENTATRLATQAYTLESTSDQVFEHSVTTDSKEDQITALDRRDIIFRKHFVDPQKRRLDTTALGSRASMARIKAAVKPYPAIIRHTANRLLRITSISTDEDTEDRAVGEMIRKTPQISPLKQPVGTDLLGLRQLEIERLGGGAVSSTKCVSEKQPKAATSPQGSEPERNSRNYNRRGRAVGRKPSAIAPESLSTPARWDQAQPIRRVRAPPPLRKIALYDVQGLSPDPLQSHDELDSVLEKINLPSKLSSRAPASDEISSRQFAPSPLTGRQTNVRRYLSRWYSTAAFGAGKSHSASIFAGQNPEGSHRVLPAPDQNTVSDGRIVGESIREHLTLWKKKQTAGTRAAAPMSPGSQFWAGEAMNSITQSVTDDESHTNVALNEEDLDVGSQIFAGHEGGVSDIINPHLFLRPGDLVDFGMGSMRTLGIFIRDSNGVAQIYSERGSWCQINPKSITLSIPGIISPDGLSDISAYLPPEEAASNIIIVSPLVYNNVPRHVGGRYIETMVNFLKVSDALFRKHAERINRAYDILSQESSKGRDLISLEEAALLILQKKRALDLTPPMLLVIHRTLIQCQNVLSNWQVHRINPKFQILPKMSLTRLHDARDWTRRYQEDVVDDAAESLFGSGSPHTTASDNPLATFAEKARKAIQFSRQNRPLSAIGTVGPSLAKVELNESRLATQRASAGQQQAFNDHEQKIVSLLIAWTATHQLKRVSKLESMGPTILRAVGMYNGMPLDKSTGFTMLQELGILTPWARWSTFDAGLGLPSHDPDNTTSVLRDQAHDSLSRLALQDSMAGSRKDWGDLPVFCIDSSGTAERDDGISLEPADGEEALCWAHIHVANPSAFLDKDSPSARYAGKVTSSIYLPDAVYPMMEPEMSQKHFSLTKDRPCITFSAKISSEGEILEKKITHGIIRNVRYLDPETVTQTLGLRDHDSAEKDHISILQVGLGSIPSRSRSRPPNLEMDRPLDEMSTATLHKMHQVSKSLQDRRRRAGAVSFGQVYHESAFPEVYVPKNQTEAPAVHAHQTQHIVGDPIISITQSCRTTGEVSSMVSEFMILAGHIGATWCSERNIPVPYRGLVRNPNPPLSPEDYRERFLDPEIASHGQAKVHVWLTYLRLVGAAYSSSSPLEHVALGLPAYCQVTSPLRRYSDLFTHWQIEAAMRHEQATGTCLVGRDSALYDDDASILPFSRSQTADVARSVYAAEKQIQITGRKIRIHWTVQALHRAYYFHEAPLPEVFETTVAMAKTAGMQGNTGILTGWGVQAGLTSSLASEKEGGVRVNDVWEGKITKVDPYHGLVSLEPIRLIRREHIDGV